MLFLYCTQCKKDTIFVSNGKEFVSEGRTYKHVYCLNCRYEIPVLLVQDKDER